MQWVINLVHRKAPTERTIGPFEDSYEASWYATKHVDEDWLRVQTIPLMPADEYVGDYLAKMRDNQESLHE